MDNIKSDQYFLLKLKQDLQFIIDHMKNVDIDELKKDEILMDSMLFRMIQISENSKKLTDKYKTEHSEIPWFAMSGLRNRIVHDYGNVELNIIYDTLKKDIPELLDVFSKL